MMDKNHFANMARQKMMQDMASARENFGERSGGGKKGSGFFGPLKRPDGSVSTEISIGVNIDGKEREIPLIVPGLSAAELKYLLNNDPDDDDFMDRMPETIINKAVDHAASRIKQNKSPFALEGERFKAPKD